MLVLVLVPVLVLELVLVLVQAPVLARLSTASALVGTSPVGVAHLTTRRAWKPREKPQGGNRSQRSRDTTSGQVAHYCPLHCCPLHPPWFCCAPSNCQPVDRPRDLLPTLTLSAVWPVRFCCLRHPPTPGSVAHTKVGTNRNPH